MTTLDIDVPRKLQSLVGPGGFGGLVPSRYKALHGGRGGTKSHFFAERVDLACFMNGARAVCIREVQNSIRDSVRQLLINKMDSMGLAWAFEVLEQEIRGRPGTPAAGALIIFRGMQAYNADNIKSLEDFDIAWVEEAQSLSDRSLRLLRPTLRKPGSELWFSWNPRYETDAVDEFFRGDNPPDDAIVVEIGWQDNPWLPEVLVAEKDLDYRRSTEMAEHVWGGGYEIITEGAYYAKLIAQAEAEGRCGNFPHDTRMLVRTGWDIGVDDYSSVWFIQDDGVEATAVDYFEANGLGPQQIMMECMPEILRDGLELEGELIDGVWRVSKRLQIGRPQPFRYSTHFFPHDVKVREWGGGAKSRVQTLVELGMPMQTIHKGVQQGPEERINATRELLPVMRFNTGEKTKTPTPAQKRVRAGLNRVRRYSRRFNEAMNTFTTVAAHDANSHGADALGEYAINARIAAPKPPAPPVEAPPAGHMKVDFIPKKRTGGKIRL